MAQKLAGELGLCYPEPGENRGELGRGIRQAPRRMATLGFGLRGRSPSGRGAEPRANTGKGLRTRPFPFPPPVPARERNVPEPGNDAVPVPATRERP